MRFPLIAIFVISTLTSFAQQEEGAIDYKSENAFGVNFNTNGGLIGGLFYRHAHYRGGNHFSTITIEAVNVRAPKEMRIPSTITGSVFVAYKTNVLLAFRGLYGRNIQLFGKAKEDGAQLELVLAAGPTIGLLKPYIIGYEYAPNDVRYEQYDPNKHALDRITNYNGFFDGLAQSKIRPGLSGRIGALFFFGHESGKFTMLEAGFAAEVYAQKIEIMAYGSNTSVFTSVYINIGFGFRR
jgi:hypothetical protein